jgi:hypothetical protein
VVRVDRVGVVLFIVISALVVALADAVGDALPFAGLPAEPGSALRAGLAGAGLVGVAVVFAVRHRPMLATLVAVTGITPATLLLAFPDLGFALLAVVGMAPLAFGAGIAGCVRARGRPEARGAATIGTPAREP